MPVRVAEARDAGAIIAVINVAFRLAEGFLIDHDRIELATVEELFQKGTFLVAEEELAEDKAAEENFVCGCVYVEPRGRDRSYLGLLAVKPQLQKSGIGSQLMQAAEGYCAKSGSRFMDLRIVSVRNELPAFYHRHGYVESGTEPFTPGLNPKVPCHFVWMSKPLV